MKLYGIKITNRDIESVARVRCERSGVPAAGLFMVLARQATLADIEKLIHESKEAQPEPTP